MSIDPASLPQRIANIAVSTPEGLAGELRHDAQYRFSYQGGGEAVALAMPNRPRPYSRGALHPIFEMNLPEGYARRFLSERLRRYARVDDMLFLAIQGHEGIGRLGYDAAIDRQTIPAETLSDILTWDGQESLFPELLERYLFNTTVSGMQPKVMITAQTPEKAALVQAGLIVKTSGEDYPQLPLNEYVCMRLAQAVGLPTPAFWLSDDQTLFIMQRFDQHHGAKLGMEDFCVLMGRSGEERYLGSYENAAKVVTTYTRSHAELLHFFDYLTFNCLIGNGDAHLKNFALLYEHPAHTPWLSPIYDVVCTRVYPLEAPTLALKMNRSQQFPDRQGLLHFAKHLGIKGANERLTAMTDNINTELAAIEELARFPELKTALLQTVAQGAALNSAQLGYRRSGDARDKQRKFT